VVWDWAAFQAQTQSRETSDIHCVTSWSRYDNAWEGVSTVDVLTAVAPKPDARFVVLHSYDGYTTNLPLEDFAAPDSILAHSWQGTPLTLEHGGPVRLVVRISTSGKAAKWIQRIEFLTEDRPSFGNARLPQSRRPLGRTTLLKRLEDTGSSSYGRAWRTCQQTPPGSTM